MKRIVACASALAVTTALSALTLVPGVYTVAASASPARGPARAAPVPEQVWLEAQITQVRHTVQSGETLSGIAVKYCGHANDWTGYYQQNRKVIGANPNLIFPGQVLTLSRCVDPASLLHLGRVNRAAATPPRRSVHASSGRTWKVTYGYPYKCGDGDRDGWDMPCTSSAPARHTASSAHRAVSPSVSHSASHYSYGGLEALWESAGGPAWAASHAAEIAECESGGNTHAYNPSGATGLWQILGAVVGGNLYDPYVNALNAVSKFKASGDTFAQWVCQ